MPGSKELHFVFECMEGNLYQLTKSRKGRPLAGGLIASIFQQIVRGLHHIHQHGYFHRDMKPENLLITTTGLADYPSSSPTALPGTPPDKDVLVLVKLADFGLARETLSTPPYTEYVSTRWYRAPEVLLRARDYSNPVDMWALGTILAEMVNLKPLFPGQSEVDQVLQICEVLGDPVRDYGVDERGRRRGGGAWHKGIRMAKGVGFEFPQAPPMKFSSLFHPNIPTSLVDCIQDLLRYEPQARLTTADCLQHVYYTSVAPRLLPSQAKAAVASTTPEQQANMMRQQGTRMVHPSQLQQSLGEAIMLTTVDGVNARRALPPSHSTMPQSNKAPFGTGSYVHAAKPIDQDIPMEISSPAHQGLSSSGDVSFAPAPGAKNRESSISQYPAFPDSASLYTSTTSHASARNDDVAMSSPYREDFSDAQASSSTMRDPNKSYMHMVGTHMTSEKPYHNVQLNEPISNPSIVSQRDSSSDQDSRGINVSNETISSKDKRKQKGWGLNISSVLGNKQQQSSQHSQAHHSHSSSDQLSASTSTASDITRTGITPAQQIAAEHAASQISLSPADSKKAKKIAEKAAREAEKAKRAAQEKAARDRARAVMQKRNQILASSNSRDQVEWLTMAENDMTRALQQQQPAQQSSHMTGHRPSMQSNIVRQPVSFTTPQPQYQQPRMSQSSTSDHSSNSVYSGRFGQPYSPLGNGQALRHVQHSSEDYFSPDDPRRSSMTSFQTRESDPGPGRLSTFPRPGSHSSLNSAPSIIDAARARLGERTSIDSRSITGSLDHQLIQNMENMTAAEGNYRYAQGSSSPAPVHLAGARPSMSRQSHGSRTSSAHRQGSASPLHYAAPRFHPYGTSSHLVDVGNHSDVLENLQTDVASTVGPSRPRSISRRQSHGQSMHRGISRGSAASRDGNFRHTSTNVSAAPLPSSSSGPNTSINPMFHVPSNHFQRAAMAAATVGPTHAPQYLAPQSSPGSNQPHTVLPPFSELAASTKVSDDEDYFGRGH